MINNPSHLEVVNPVVYGCVKSIIDYMQSLKPEEYTKSLFSLRALGLIIHGDAAVSGQGTVYENLQMMNLTNYSIKGSIHIVANNLIGFTTNQKDGRSTLYCTDIAKFLGVPIIHVNAQHPLEVDYALEMAMKYKEKFQKDVYIDLIGYRVYGHNEVDNPTMTQPIMYSEIDKLKTKMKRHLKLFSLLPSGGEINPAVYDFCGKCFDEGIVTEKEIQEMKETFLKEVEDAITPVNELRIKMNNPDDVGFKIPMQNLHFPLLHGRIKDTGIPREYLLEMAKNILSIPKDFNMGKNLSKIYQQRVASLEANEVDWSTAEALAFRSLIEEGYSIRLSGEDVERGTFSQRISRIHDVEKPFSIFPVKNGLDFHDFRKLHIGNSFLSEFAVLGFEYGYTLMNPNCLVIWEAQFGDFANCAQAMIDNFILSGEVKWGIQSGLILNLPHGLQGQGPEHSSARIERFLQLQDDDITFFENQEKQSHERIRKQIENSNFQVIFPTTPSNYFHALRRQNRRLFRKPLINIFSKGLLRNVYSNISEMGQGTRFLTVLDDPVVTIPKDKVSKVMLCTGHVYHALSKERETRGLNDVSIIRLEQIAPFPYNHLKIVLQNYPNAKVIWVQEEHQNQGAWSYVNPRINAVLKGLSLPTKNAPYVGRPASGSTAAGGLSAHEKELRIFLRKAFEI